MAPGSVAFGHVYNQEATPATLNVQESPGLSPPPPNSAPVLIHQPLIPVSPPPARRRVKHSGLFTGLCERHLVARLPVSAHCLPGMPMCVYFISHRIPLLTVRSADAHQS